MLATLTLAGLRIGELLALRWRDVDLASARLHVGEAKTDAGRRTVDLSPVLRDELAAHKARAQRGGAGDLVFCTRNGLAQNRNDVRRRVLVAAVKCGRRLAKDEARQPLPGSHRHRCAVRFASLLFEAGAQCLMSWPNSATPTRR